MMGFYNCITVHNTVSSYRQTTLVVEVQYLHTFIEIYYNLSVKTDD